MELFDEHQREMEELADEFEEKFEEVFTFLYLLASAEVLLLTQDNLKTWDERWARMLKSSGFYDVLQDYSKRVDELDESVREIAKRKVDKTKLTLLKKLQIEHMEKLGIDAGLRLKTNLYKQIMSGVTQQELVKALSKELQGTRYKSYAKMYVNTAINDYRQLLWDERANDTDVWIYQGADIDGKTREFCKCVLNQNSYYTSDQKTSIQLNPKRRYNCRHGLFPLSEEAAQLAGFNEAKGTCK